MRKMLVVDDDAAILEVLEIRLASMGFDVTATSDPDKAIGATQEGRFDLPFVGETLASSGVMDRVLDAVAQAALETIDAERCVVFQLTNGRLVPMANAGTPPALWSTLEAAASLAMDKGVPTTMAGGDGHVL